jgi:hypothetical protein
VPLLLGGRVGTQQVVSKGSLQARGQQGGVCLVQLAVQCHGIWPYLAPACMVWLCWSILVLKPPERVLAAAVPLCWLLLLETR